MDKINLEVTSRTEVGKQNQALRKSGSVPAIAYGRGVDPLKLKVDAKSVEKAYHKAGTSRIINLKIDDQPAKNALFAEVQLNPRTDALSHIDFYLVRMDEKIRTEVPLHFVGESSLIYQDNGTLLKNLEVLEIEALPGDLPENFEVDISVLDEFEKPIHVSDLTIPQGVEVLVDPEELVAKIEAPRSEEEIEADLAEPIEEIMPESEQGAPAEGEDEVVVEESGGNRDREPKEAQKAEKPDES